MRQMIRRIELFVPAVTPFADDLSVDHDRLVRHGRALLEAGAHGLAPFGTTSEATSLTLDERRAALDAMLQAGLPAQAMIPGTGCAAVGETVTLTRHAVEAGCRGVLMLPPFYYKGMSEQGVFDAYAHVIDRVGAERLRVYLYHFPQMSGVPITPGLIERLLKAYPGTIVGLKDSSGDWDNTAAILQAFPELDVYSASESLLSRNAAAGGAGCISATANVNAAGIRRLIDALGTGRETECAEKAAAVRRLFDGLPTIPATKATLARIYDDPTFARVRPPLVVAGAEHEAVIEEAVKMTAGAEAPAV